VISKCRGSAGVFTLLSHLALYTLHGWLLCLDLMWSGNDTWQDGVPFPHCHPASLRSSNSFVTAVPDKLLYLINDDQSYRQQTLNKSTGSMWINRLMPRGLDKGWLLFTDSVLIFDRRTGVDGNGANGVCFTCVNPAIQWANLMGILNQQKLALHRTYNCQISRQWTWRNFKQPSNTSPFFSWAYACWVSTVVDHQRSKQLNYEDCYT
jgi:hypothetical protein